MKKVDRIKFNWRTCELWINDTKVLSEDGFHLNSLNKNETHSATVKIPLPDTQITTE